MILEGVDRYRVTDPNFECVRIVLAHRGEVYSPAYIQGISGMAFRIAGPCPCAPTCCCTDTGGMQWEALPKLLGHELECVNVSAGADPAQDAPRAIAQIREEIRAGRPVPVWNAFTNYEWDVVAGFDERERQFLGRGTYAGMDGYAAADEGRMVNGMDVTSTFALLIGDRVAPFDARAAELAALEEAVRHSRSPRDRFLAGAGNRAIPFRFRGGLACYEAWAHSFRVDPGRVPDGGTDRYPMGVFRSTHRAAGAFLREIAPKYPEARASLEQAAVHFDADADRLDECFLALMGGWQGWQEPDPARAGRMAGALLEAGKCYGQGMAEIERALAILAPERLTVSRCQARIARGAGKAEIVGVPGLAWDSHQLPTCIGALAASLKFTEHPYSYPDLMGLSGLAFRVRWANDGTRTRWCPSAAVGEMPDELAALGKLTGWDMPAEWVEPAGRDDERLRTRIVSSIDSGRPVLTYPDSFDMSVVVGYEEEGRTVLVDDYEHARPVRLPVAKLQPLQIYLGDFRKPPSLRSSLRQALRMAVGNWHRERHGGGLPDREYWYGDAALGAWIADLRRGDALSESTRQQLQRLDAWSHAHLVDARQAAVGFLRGWSTLVDGEAREALQGALGQYDAEVKLLKGTDWAKETGARKADVLTEARRLETCAIGFLEKALALPWAHRTGRQARP